MKQENTIGDKVYKVYVDVIGYSNLSGIKDNIFIIFISNLKVLYYLVGKKVLKVIHKVDIKIKGKLYLG